MKKDVMIITPMLREFHCARESFGAEEEELKPFRTARASFGNCNLRIICCAHDLAGMIVYAENHYGIPDLLIDSGTAGALSESVDMGDVLAGELFFYGNEPEIQERIPGWVDEAKIQRASVLTVDEPVLTATDRFMIEENADICTMETYPLALAARRWGCPFTSFRVVTDHADENTAVKFKKNSRPYCMTLYSVLKQMLKNRSH